MDARAYLDRIGWSGGVSPDLETLRKLTRAHLSSVPFENLDIHLGREIVLDRARLFAKIVGERRGGFCYELNGLFAALLEEFGFRVTLLSAGVARKAGGFGPEFDHLTLLVDAGGSYLADVGFGDDFIEPVPLDHRGSGEYRLEREGDYCILMRGTQPRYRFTLTPHRLEDFRDRCRYHQTSPESSFTQSRLITRATPDGRITLTDTRLIVTRDGRREERLVTGPTEFLTLAAEYFGLEFSNSDRPRNLKE